MSQWRDPERWAWLRSEEGCALCRGGGPRDVVAELEVSRVTMGAEAPLPGYCCLVLRRHAVELYELQPQEADAFMRDVQRLARG